MSDLISPSQKTNNLRTSPITTTLSSGREVKVHSQGKEQIEVYSPSGLLELAIQFTESGPVLKLSGVRLQLQATEEIEVQCNRFAVHSTEETCIQSEGNVNITAGGEMRLQTEKATHINGEMIYLNCDDPIDPSNPPT